jgi:tetratricopeptide (TPR) repeat protein
MGRGRTLAGKFIYFCSAGLVFFLLAGFTTPTEVIAASSRQDVSPPRAPKQKEPAKPTVEDLLRAKGLFDLGDYVAAMEENQKIISRSPKNSLREQALFNMGLIYSHVENPQRNLGKALQFFKTVLKEYPQGPLTGETKVLVGVLQEKEQLSQMIEKFKHEKEGMSQEIERYKRENKELNQMIEKFKQVDVDVEEKQRERSR